MRDALHNVCLLYNLSMSDSADNLDYYLDHIFDEIDPNIRLDDEQKAAVKGDDDSALVVAGAGTGKTTVIAAKVKYLVDVKHVQPEKILVMSYTRKAVEELRRRINVDLNIPAEVLTFHSLGLNFLRHLNDKKVIPIDSNERKEYFLNFLKETIFSSREQREDFMACFNDEEIHWLDPRSFSYGSFFMENHHKFQNFDEYFEAYKAKKIRETKDITQRVIDIVDAKVNGDFPTTIRGERVKSKGEAVIANFLYCHNIDYRYERVYDELVGERQIMRPDFSIDIGGERIYIEYFGLSGGDLDNHSYSRIRRLKEDFHREKHNKFIALNYMPNRQYLQVLKTELHKLGVNLRPRPIVEVYDTLLDQNPLAEFFHLEYFFYSIIDDIKGSEKVNSFEEYKQLCAPEIKTELQQHQINWIEKFCNYYHSQKDGDGSAIRVDYADMIKLPRGQLAKIIPSKKDFDYIIVDEYQDISAARYNLLKETIDVSHAKFFAIGDDWQSIFSFQGAKVGYIMHFEKYFPGSSRYVISNTYRNAQQLIDAAGKFVMRNHSQIRKDLKSRKDLHRPICFVKIRRSILSKRETLADRNATIESMIRQIHHTHPKASICVIGRTNRAIESLFTDSNFINSAESKARIKGIDNFYFDAMTIHKSKGLTYDWTIIMPLTKFFPSDPKKVFWAKDIVRNEPEEEAVPYAESRRLLYVALTRTKNRVFILMPKRGDHSIYKDELNSIIRELEALRERR